MDFEFRAQQDQDRRSVEDLFDFQGRMIGRGTYGKVFKAKRKDGLEFIFIFFHIFSYFYQ
jgi:cyclin-dependent kinase 8/11